MFKARLSIMFFLSFLPFLVENITIILKIKNVKPKVKFSFFSDKINYPDPNLYWILFKRS